MKISDTEIDETVKFIAETRLTDEQKATAADQVKELDAQIDELANSLLNSSALKKKAILCLLEIASEGQDKVPTTILSHIQVAMMVGYIIGRKQEREKNVSPTS